MRVVMVGPFGLRPRGTMSVRALPMAKALVARGHAVTMLLPPWQNPEDAGRCWEEDGVCIENITLPSRLPLQFHALTALRLARRALALRPDVVHLFKPKAYSGLTHYLLARIPRQRRPRLVVDTDDWEGPGGWNEIGGYTPAQRRFFTWQERWGLTHADAVTVASRTLESLVWALGVPREQVFYIPNGVSSSSLSILHPPFSILLYTRFFEFPISRVIELLHRVRERVPEARLLVVGKGLFGEEEELFNLAVQSGLTITHHVSRLTSDVSHLTSDVSHLTSDVSRLTSDVSRLTSDVSHFTSDVTYCGWIPLRHTPHLLRAGRPGYLPLRRHAGQPDQVCGQVAGPAGSRGAGRGRGGGAEPGDDPPRRDRLAGGPRRRTIFR